jgi:mannose-binding lectin 1
VMFHNGMTQNNQDYEMCLRAENIHLPKFGHFGLSAATGGLADDHDVYHFLTTALYPAEMIQDSGKMGQDAEKLTQEYQEYQKKLDQQKEDYRKEHPDENKDDLDDWFETDSQRELKQIWQAQSQTTDALRDLSRKLDEVLGRQERTLGLLSVSGSQGQIQHQPGQQQHQQPQYNTGTGYGVTKQDIDLLLQNQQALSATLRDVSNLVGDVQQKANSLLSKGTATVQTGSYQDGPIINEMRDGINSLKHLLGQMGVGSGQAQGQVTACPQQKCLGLTPFLIAIIVQLVITLGYNIYRDNREAQAKKFY